MRAHGGLRRGATCCTARKRVKQDYLWNSLLVFVDWRFWAIFAYRPREHGTSVSTSRNS